VDDYWITGQLSRKDFISNHPFLRRTVRRAIPLFAKCFTGQMLACSKTLGKRLRTGIIPHRS
jgi:hypothetical protein